MTTRRDVLKAGGVAVGTAAFAGGFSETGKRILDTVVSPAQALGVNGHSQKPEFRVNAGGALELNPDCRISYTMCMACTTQCGVRVRIDNATDTVTRVTGNPYSPLSTFPHIGMGASVRDSFLGLTRASEISQSQRSSVCGRGNAMLEHANSPYRITVPLKRVGPRNGGRWEPISFEQLVHEVVEGGNLFGEGEVKGLRALRSFDPIDPEQPELGPKVNRVAMLSGANYGRNALIQRFLQKSFGTINFTGHGAYCGGSFRAGFGAAFGDLKTQPHTKPDLDNAEFVMFMGTAPGNAGNPYKRQGAQLARARTEGKLNYAIVDPAIGHSDNLAARHRGRWVPILPGTDGALAMAMIRWIIDEKRFDAKFLAQPNGAAAKAAGEAGWTNASHLVVTDPEHPRCGCFVRGSDIGLPIAGDAKYKDADPFVIVDEATDKLAAHTAMTWPAPLFVERQIEIAGQTVNVASAMSLLAKSARSMTLAEYSGICGIAEDVITGLAKEFTSHGKKAAVTTHGGTMTGNGFQSAFAIVMLNTLVGNLNVKGGAFTDGGGFNPWAGRYVLNQFAGGVAPSGVPLSRSFPYEKTTEFKRKKEQGKPYPAEAPWFSFSAQMATEWLPAALAGYPYGLDAFIMWSANPVYGIAGLRPIAEKTLGDPKKIPLVIAIDPYINESTAFADYIVPDTTMFESWGFTVPFAGVPTKSMTCPWPVVTPKTAKTADGQFVGAETFVIALAKAMALPGFGDDAIKDANGATHALNRAEDWYYRAAANVAFGGKAPVGNASDDDIALAGVSRHMPAMRTMLGEEEARKVAFLYSRGGRFQPASETWSEAGVSAWPYTKPLQIWNETVGTAHDSMTGKRLSGTPGWVPMMFADGSLVTDHYPAKDWPMRLISQKSPLVGAYSVLSKRILGVRPDNPVGINHKDAEAMGIRTGDRIRISTPSGSVKATALVRHSVREGVIVIEFGFGHREFGARSHKIGPQYQPKSAGIGAGVLLNDVGLIDPTRKTPAIFLDHVLGTAVRQAIPAKVSREV